MQITVNDFSDLPKPFEQILNGIYGERMSVVLIKGLPQSGKTNFALVLAEILKSKGLIDEFATNALIQNCDWIKKITALNILKAWGYSNNKKKLFVYDEINQSVIGRRSMSTLNVEWARNLPQISHQSMHILCLAQEAYKDGKRFYDSTFIDPAFGRGIWYKPYKTAARFTSSKWPDGYWLEPIPKTNISFEHDNQAFFELDASETDDFGSQPLIVQISSLYGEGLSFEAIKDQLKLKNINEVKRGLMKYCKGSTKANVKVMEDKEDESV
jgi:hypothetical protein